MSLLLSDIHLPALITSTLSEHSTQPLPWNNLDQLSCLWGVFTKCKKNIRDGFRLENLSWRLWYRQSVLHKKIEPKTSEDINFNQADTVTKHSLRRIRSLPDLSQWSQQKSNVGGTRSGSMTPIRSTRQKKIAEAAAPSSNFSMDSESESDEEELESEEEEEEEEILTFTKKSSYTPPATLLINTSLKSVSLLSDMLQQEENISGSNFGSNNGGRGLRRCQSRYCRLDQFFLNANASPTIA